MYIRIFFSEPSQPGGVGSCQPEILMGEGGGGVRAFKALEPLSNRFPNQIYIKYQIYQI
jgi:hypothetical protein